MHAVRQAIVPKIESQALQEECSNFQSLSPRRELAKSSSFYFSNHEEFLSTSQLRSNSYCVSCVTKHVDVDFSSTSEDTYHPPLQDVSLDNTSKSTLLLSMTLPNSSMPHSFTEEQSSSRKLRFHDSDSSDKENELIKVESTTPSIKSWEMLDPSIQSVLPNEDIIIM